VSVVEPTVNSRRLLAGGQTTLRALTRDDSGDRPLHPGVAAAAPLIPDSRKNGRTLGLRFVAGPRRPCVEGRRAFRCRSVSRVVVVITQRHADSQPCSRPPALRTRLQGSPDRLKRVIHRPSPCPAKLCGETWEFACSSVGESPETAPGNQRIWGGTGLVRRAVGTWSSVRRRLGIWVSHREASSSAPHPPARTETASTTSIPRTSRDGRRLPPQTSRIPLPPALPG